MPAAVGKSIFVQAPTLGADSQAMDTWIHHFVDLLEAAAPTEEKKEGEYHWLVIAPVDLMFSAWQAAHTVLLSPSIWPTTLRCREWLQ